jgi:hypothetical protein
MTDMPMSRYCGELEAENARLREALRKIAEHGESHMGYVNAVIDGQALSAFARDASGVPKPY